MFVGSAIRRFAVEETITGGPVDPEIAHPQPTLEDGKLSGGP
jgi:hypothetical protein